MYRDIRPRDFDESRSSSTDSSRPQRQSGESNEKAPPPPIPPSRHPTSLVPKRRAVFVACEECRRRKERCDGGRPVCAPCARRGSECIYASDPGDLGESLVMKRQNDSLRRENEQFRELFDLIRKIPHADAYETLTHIRGADNPLAALRYARSASLLLANPDEYPARGGGATAASVSIPTDSPVNARLESLNLKALSDSQIRVHARPWTVVVGDGLVSDLISSFFAWDHSFFYPGIDQAAFLEDMRRGNIAKARFCTPFLVNAICASRYVGFRNLMKYLFRSSNCNEAFARISTWRSPSKLFSSIGGKDLGQQFLDEAKKLLDLEMGTASLPTVQGLSLLFTVSAYRGTDRAGLMYRYASYEMLRRLNLERTFNGLKEESALRSRQIISKAVWGLFCFESLVSHVYLQQSLLRPPQIPRCFDSNFELSDFPSSSNVDIFGESFTSSSRQPALVPGVLNAMCDLSEIMYRVMSLNEIVEEVGSDDDVAKRQQMFEDVKEWRKDLPRHLREDVNFTSQTCFLRIYMDQLIINIMRPLPPETLFDQEQVAADLCIQVCSADISLMEKYIENFTLAEYSCMACCGAYNAVMTLVSHLNDAKTHNVFARACFVLRRIAADYPIADFILQGVQALAWSLRSTIPEEARPFLQRLGSSKEDLRDVPLAFALPQAASVRKGLYSVSMFADNDDRDEESYFFEDIDMGRLLSKWSSMSIGE